MKGALKWAVQISSRCLADLINSDFNASVYHSISYFSSCSFVQTSWNFVFRFFHCALDNLPARL